MRHPHTGGCHDPHFPRTMKLHLTEHQERNVIRRYEDGRITINDRTFQHSLIVTPEDIVDDWGPETVDELTAEDLDSLTQLEVEVVILGTGVRQVFPDPRVLEPLMTASLGFEVMDSGAAARTFNILAAEGRKVAAAILM